MVEHSIGNGEVESSILSRSTIFPEHFSLWSLGQTMHSGSALPSRIDAITEKNVSCLWRVSEIVLKLGAEFKLNCSLEFQYLMAHLRL